MKSERWTEKKNRTKNQTHFSLFSFLSFSPILLFKRRLLAEASTVQETLTDGIHKLEKSIENLHVRLARLLSEYSASQAKLKQRISKLEIG